MNKRDYNKIADGIRQLYSETLKNKPEIKSNIECYDIVKYCELNKKLFRIGLSKKDDNSDNEELKIEEKKNELVLGFVKGTDGDKEFVRMVFSINDDSKKIKNSQKLAELLAIIERTLVYIDHIRTEKVNSRIFLDIIKYPTQGKYRWI